MAIRTLCGSCAILMSSVTTLSTTMLLIDEPVWICLMLCNVDILFSILVVHIITTNDHKITNERDDMSGTTTLVSPLSRSATTVDSISSKADTNTFSCMTTKTTTNTSTQNVVFHPTFALPPSTITTSIKASRFPRLKRWTSSLGLKNENDDPTNIKVETFQKQVVEQHSAAKRPPMYGPTFSTIPGHIGHARRRASIIEEDVEKIDIAIPDKIKI